MNYEMVDFTIHQIREDQLSSLDFLWTCTIPTSETPGYLNFPDPAGHDPVNATMLAITRHFPVPFGFEVTAN
jgi:hypothetical protein